MEPNDEELARAFLGGDEAAFRLLYRRHTPMLYAMATRLVGATACDDVVQNAWMRAAAALHRFRWESSLRTWLCGFVFNCARELRSSWARETTDDILAVADNTIVAGWNDGSAVHIDLERAIARLSPRYREVFLLHDIEQYEHKEIASILGIDIGTSKSNLSRARAVLRRLLQPHCEETKI
jgi:RNA polymerase sigma-70 factor, ECF subfamily